MTLETEIVCNLIAYEDLIGVTTSLLESASPGSYIRNSIDPIMTQAIGVRGHEINSNHYRIGSYNKDRFPC